MISYELAKKLKDAGFPHPFREDAAESQPDLSELIEACGEEFGALVHDGFKYLAHSKSILASDHILEGGKKPEEAVAKLWLALNKKA